MLGLRLLTKERLGLELPNAWKTLKHARTQAAHKGTVGV